MGTRALVGRFHDGSTRFEARPVHFDGQPTWMLPQLAAIYQHRFNGDVERMHARLMVRDWSLLNAATPQRSPDDRYVYEPGIGRGYLAAEHPAPLDGDRVTNRPDGDIRWLYLWEHRFGALHVFRSAAGRWHHLATLDRPQVAWFDAAIAHDIEARENWLGATG